MGIKIVIFISYITSINSSCLNLCKDILYTVNNNHNILKSVERKINYIIFKPMPPPPPTPPILPPSPPDYPPPYYTPQYYILTFDIYNYNTYYNNYTLFIIIIILLCLVRKIFNCKNKKILY